MSHDYAVDGRAFPGSMSEHGATAQSNRVVPPAIFTEPEVLDQAEVGQPAVKRADGKPANSRQARKRSR
jgi:hypothetical protein